MRRFITLFLLIGVVSLNAKGQKTFIEIINDFKLPLGWDVKISNDTSYWPLFKKKQLGSWTLTNKANKHEKVSFFIFNYSDKDELVFTEGINSYYMLSSCLNISSKNESSNFKSFQKENFLFVMAMCPCSTAESTFCRKLAESIFKWSYQ